MEILDVERKAFEQWFDRWNFEYINSLSISSGRGVKTKGFETVIEQQIELQNRNI